MSNIFEQSLDRNAANFTPITPLLFLERSAEVYPNRLAIIHGNFRQTWQQTYERCSRLASALQKNGIGLGDTVAVMLPNIPAMVEAHFGIPMSGAVLNALNTRLDAESIAFMLNHGEAKVVLVDPEFSGVMKKALEIAEKESGRKILVIDVDENQFDVPGEKLGKLNYEELLAQGIPDFAWQLPADEWQAICLNYTSGTTGNPKGVVYHHRGAAINAISNILDWDIPKHPIYLWTLPMFHCNGWCFPWTLAARAGVNVCLRRVDAQHIFTSIKSHGVTHYCAAPIVHNLLVNAPDHLKEGVPSGVKGLIAGAPPPASIIEGMEKIGFDLTHVYGLTETYGPAAICVQQDQWQNLDIGERARLNARQGVRYHLQQAIAVLNPETLKPVPADGETMGEIMFKGNIAMKGYLKNPKATHEAFEGGWFHSGDLAVITPDGYVKIKDRSKDIIISGGENISSIEVEDVLYRHPAVLAAAVVAMPDPKWGETPCAFLEIKSGVEVTSDEIIAHCKKHLAGFKVPKVVVFGELPKTSTGKIQKFELRKKVGSVGAIDV
ncbi:acyl-CoA synthetase [Polynucleobacter paneuropaeus]|jgi:fatty-acyl-CoA synthase|uniref:acyl-CoA synthetase n=1 Tax=Polynucleobacter paneuropaeus TaxID=2527775 RepID=UPI000DBEF970|nr:acyl-CoA synthetase [Polynucleobacter paneuropaeus]AWW46500.1 acyl-CoA synthetase [Polynucleobacter paneuropaeus]MBT8516486.1 acyl-CoA synthetase [Polynucleobacter paneuropaeus]MBT8517938.1 acyl-CoA synthetase [Polynucleobacter paneuropaeus]MBT8531784.1 acyl-CoA synthetase [Polynucleobacter paneuropaeus]MBT8544191.1 acyl-CoA synthetase [Polynucleobacter paneuropaeus]